MNNGAQNRFGPWAVLCVLGLLVACSDDSGEDKTDPDAAVDSGSSPKADGTTQENDAPAGEEDSGAPPEEQEYMRLTWNDKDVDSATSGYSFEYDYYELGNGTASTAIVASFDSAQTGFQSIRLGFGGGKEPFEDTDALCQLQSLRSEEDGVFFDFEANSQLEGSTCAITTTEYGEYVKGTFSGVLVQVDTETDGEAPVATIEITDGEFSVKVVEE